MASIAEINIKIGATIDGMVKGLKSAERSLAASGRKMQALGQSLSTTVSLPLIGVGVAGAKMAGELSDNFSKIENLVGITGQTLKDFEQGVKDVSGRVGKSQAELSDALFTITSAGLKGGEALDVLDSAAKASVIGMGATRDIAQAATAVIAAYGAENYTASEAVNLLTKTVKEGNLEASELAPTIGKLLPLASQMGVSFEEVGANIATFTRLGVKAPEAVTALKALLSNLIKPGKEAQDSLAGVGLSVEQLQDSIKSNGLSATLQELIQIYDGNTEGIAKLFGSVEGLANVFGTAGGQAEDYTKILESMKDGTDIVQKGFDNASKKGPEVFRQSMVKLQNVMIDVGNVVIPFATTLAEQVARVATAFAGLDASTQKYIVVAAGIAAAIGPALKVYGTLLSTMSAIKTAQIAAAENFKKLSGTVLNAAQAFQKMDIIMKASVIGAVVAGVGLAIIAYQNYASQLTTVQKVQQELQSVQIAASQAIVKEKIESEQLIAVIKNVNSSYGEKRNALTELQRIAPSYFSNLDIEKSSLEEIELAQKRYIENLKQMAKVQAAQDRLVELNKKLLDTKAIVEESKSGILGYASTLLKSAGAGSIMGFSMRNDVAVNVKKTTQDIEAQIDALTDLIASEKDYASAKRDTNNIPTGVGATALPTTSSSSDLSKIKPFGDFIKPALEGIDKNPSKKYKELEETIKRINTSTKALVLTNKELNEQLTSVPANLDKLSVPDLDVDMLEKTQEAISLIGEIGNSVSATIGQLYDNKSKKIEQSYEREKRAIENSALNEEAKAKAIQRLNDETDKKRRKANREQAIAAKAAAIFAATINTAQAISKVYGQTGLGGIPLAPIIAALGAAQIAAIAATPIPALATGGLAYGETLATVGDNRNARVDPEVIAPLSKLKKLMPQNQNTSPIPLMGKIQVRGSDLLVILENAEKDRKRQG